MTPNSQVTFETLQQSFLYLEIMYNSDIEYTSITEQPAVTPIELIANVGGTLGLFIGVSLLSFLEMVEILIKIISILIKK